MPRRSKQSGGTYVRAPKPIEGDHLSIEERALLKALGIDAVTPRLAKKIKAEAPFLPVEERAEKIREVVAEDGDQAFTDLRIRVPTAVYRQIEEVAKLQELTITSAAVRLLLLGANKLGTVYDREKIEIAVRRIISEILLPVGTWSSKEGDDNNDPFSSVDPRMLGRGLATELIRAKRKEDGNE
jgi:hypothetical protein